MHLGEPKDKMPREPTTEENNSNAQEIGLNPPDSRFSSKEKWFIVTFVAFVGLFSPLTANIYLPAIPILSKAFNKSTGMINLTVTMYMVLQGIAPMVWGPLSDRIGRRPTSAACLLILSLSCVGLALVPTNAFWLLMLLRCFQASGSASTVAIGTGVIGDISTRAERGGFYGVFILGPMVGTTIGPVIGGALTGHLGWRSSFWFLMISSSTCLALITIFQPETLHSLVERGGDKIPILYKPIVPLIGKEASLAPTRLHSQRNRMSKNPFLIFHNLDITMYLAISAISCTVFYGTLAPISSLFKHSYPFLTEIELGLCFLGMGFGMALGSFMMGRILDSEYARFKRRLKATVINEEAVPGNITLDDDFFPLELARLRFVPVFSLILAVTCAAYGWCLEKKVHLAIPIILHSIVGYTTISIMNACQTLMIDLLPDQSSAVSACNNLTRCALSAALVSVIDPMINSIGIGWTYVLHSGLSLAIVPLYYFTM